MHITYGVLMLSSLLFISVQDALSVVGRYFVSALVCRALVAFELAGMSKASTVIEAVESEESEAVESDESGTELLAVAVKAP